MHYYIVLILYQYYNSVLTSILSALIASITSLTFAIVSSLKFGFSLGIPTASFLASNLNTWPPGNSPFISSSIIW